MDLASGMPDLSTRSPPAAAHQGAGLPAKITVAQICPRICISPQKIFRLGSRCKSAVSLSSEWESGFIFEYLDLCQSPANIWEGTTVDREVKEMNRDFRGIPLHSAFRSETRDIMAFPPFHFPSFCFFICLCHCQCQYTFTSQVGRTFNGTHLKGTSCHLSGRVQPLYDPASIYSLFQMVK